MLNLLPLKLSSVAQITHDKIFHRLTEICEMIGVVLSMGVNVGLISLLERCCISGEGESVIPNKLDGHKN